MPTPAALCWLLFLLLFHPPDVVADQHISFVLTPRGYKDPRTMDNFTCGVDTSVDPGRHLAEQNTIYIFETFLDKTKETNPEYKTKVYDVVTFNKAGVAENMLDNQLGKPDMEEPGLYALFLTPPKAQCNTRTFEDAAETAGAGYFPIFVGVNGNFTEMIDKFKGSSETFKAFYNGVIPKLCGTKQKMRNETAHSRRETITTIFNMLYNAEPERSLLPTHEKGCWSSDETMDAVKKADLFDLAPGAKFKTRNTSLSVSESDGFAKTTIERSATDRKALVLVKTEFPAAGGGVEPAGPDDIVEFDGPVIFQQHSNTTEVFIRIKIDKEEEGPEGFDITLQDGAAITKRVKRTVNDDPSGSSNQQHATIDARPPGKRTDGFSKKGRFLYESLAWKTVFRAVDELLLDSDWVTEISSILNKWTKDTAHFNENLQKENYEEIAKKCAQGNFDLLHPHIQTSISEHSIVYYQKNDQNDNTPLTFNHPHWKITVPRRNYVAYFTTQGATYKQMVTERNTDKRDNLISKHNDAKRKFDDLFPTCLLQEILSYDREKEDSTYRIDWFEHAGLDSPSEKILYRLTKSLYLHTELVREDGENLLDGPGPWSLDQWTNLVGKAVTFKKFMSFAVANRKDTYMTKEELVKKWGKSDNNYELKDVTNNLALWGTHDVGLEVTTTKMTKARQIAPFNDYKNGQREALFPIGTHFSIETFEEDENWEVVDDAGEKKGTPRYMLHMKELDPAKKATPAKKPKKAKAKAKKPPK